MTNIMSIDALFQTQQHEAKQQPVQNFAHELAKSNQQENPSAQDGTKSNGNGQPDLQELAAGTKPPSLSAPQVEYETVANLSQASLMSQVPQLKDATVTPTGITEALLGARVFGWHALAQAYLSQLTVAEKDSSKANPTEELATSTEESLTSAEGAEADLSESPSTQDVAEDVVAMPDVDVFSQDQPRVVSSDAGSVGALESVAADAQVSAYWAARSLRLVRQRDGGVVAWLRDFRVTDGDQPTLVKAVLNEAKSQGFALNKIMLNGREVWSSLISH